MRLFLSHSSAEKRFARRLAEDLRRIGHEVWFDEWSVPVGEPILDRVGRALDRCDALLVILSPRAVSSPFVDLELTASLWQALTRRRTSIIPLVLEDVDIPPLLRGRRFADFRSHYIVGWSDLIRGLHRPDRDAGITNVYSDIVDMGSSWDELFEHSALLDLAIMYGATWRNTHRKRLAALVGRPGARLRIALPDTTNGSPVVRVYAARLGIGARAFRALVTDALEDFRSLGDSDVVELYQSRVVFTHAVYLFETVGILALYTLCCERRPTPALAVRDGPLLGFLRSDFDRLIDPAAGRCLRIH